MCKLIFQRKIGKLNYMEIIIVKDKISSTEFKRLAEETFGDMVKIVVDIKREIMAVGGEMHADAESLLLEKGSSQADLWGVNIYPDLSDDEKVEYQSLINIRPSIGNKSMEVENEEIRKKINDIINKLIE